MPTIIPVVEGPGDVDALPGLLYRILSEKLGHYDVMVAHGKANVVNAHNRSNLENKLEKYLRYALNQPDCAAILVLVDADDDCPVVEFQRLSQRCEQSGVGVPVQIVYAHREFESWFLASWETVKDQAGLPNTESPVGPIENVANPKQWIIDRKPKGEGYKPTSHQVSYTTAINLDLAHQNSRSFRRLCHALELLVGAMDQA